MQTSHLVVDQISIQVQPNSRKRSSRLDILSDVSFQVERGNIACILGPSGCGKSTLLRAIAGFEALTAGNIWLNQSLVSSALHHVSPEHRKTGIVFQDYALFPHLTVAENICFGIRGLSKGVQIQRLVDLCALVEIKGLESRYPHELSGGQQQRVALARALAPQPDVLLLDEPFSSLDTVLRLRIAKEIRAIIKESGTTALLVTHDQEEAFAFADDLGLLLEGKLQQWGKAAELYHCPSSLAVAQFIGQGTAIGPILATADRELMSPLGVVKHAVIQKNGTYYVFIRPEHLALVRHVELEHTVEIHNSFFAGNHYVTHVFSPDMQQSFQVFTAEAILPNNPQEKWALRLLEGQKPIVIAA